MKLFDLKENEENAWANYTERAYDFYCRTTIPACISVRSLLEEWFVDYPDEHKYELKRGLRDSFDNVFFELYIYTLLKVLGYKVLVHPELPNGTKKHPDFLAINDKESIYIEAMVVTGKAKDKTREDKIKKAVYDSINKIKSDQYFLGVEKFELLSQMSTPPVYSH